MDGRNEGSPHRPGAHDSAIEPQHGADRWVWLAHALDDELRAPLRRALLWTQHLLRDVRRAGDALEAPLVGSGGDPPDSAGDGAASARDSSGSRSDRNRKAGYEFVEKELTGALSFVDDLLVVGCTEWMEGRDPWIRSIVVRDLANAAVRRLEPEARARFVEIEARVSPEGLRLVADPDWALHAVEALLRAGIRSASRGQVSSVEISDSDENPLPRDGIDGWVEMTIHLPGGSLDRALDLGEAETGRPWRWTGAPTGGLTLSLAAAGCYARLLGGVLDMTEVGDPSRIRVRIRLPSHRTPERRPGWIP